MTKSSTVPTTVRVELERAALQPGDELNGTVYLSLPQTLDGNSLKVRVLGRQALHWDKELASSGGGGDNKLDHLNEELILAEKAVFAAGDSLYPFSFQLPDDLQHSFTYVSRAVRDMQGIHVDVQYEVDAIFTLGSSTINASTQFRIDPVPSAVPFGRSVNVAKEEAITYLGMFNRGACGVALSIDMDVLDSSSTIDAHVTLDLKTSLSRKHVSLVLYQKAVVDRHHQLFPRKLTVYRKVCSQQLDKAEVSGPTGTAGATELTIQLPLLPNKISDSDPLTPTMASYFVDISYRVELEVKFAMVPRIIVGVPVTVIQKLVAPQELEVASLA